MNFTKTDFVISMGMTIAVIFMSFTFPALGMTGDSVQENEIPEFNITKGSADFAREQPEYPARPSEGTLTYKNNSANWADGRQTYLQKGDTEYLVSFFDNSDNQNPPEWKLNLIKFNSSGSYSESTIITEGESKTLTSADGSYEIGFNNLEIEDSAVGNETASVDWKVLEQPSDSTWIGRLPVVGGLISGANQLASVVGWIGAIIWHFVVQILVTIGNTLLIFYNIFVYFLEFMYWITTAYSGVVAGAPTAWASVIVAIPGILLGFEFVKLVALAISLLPLT
ncbi:hypothetical protein [His 1 virus]|uniref:Structural protein 26 n=1 Tax=His1 virus (isolate Australia/Victoria) TaxID=654912 RepID=VP26_HIS1I|nr:hypothetical protein His1V_gp26 [His 1 virus]Q25BG9.1 RecName: Full=Structural protein 26 [His1 virus (isolate Victoria)]AAQ13744.1 hypothetical protein [His 1 virus]